MRLENRKLKPRLIANVYFQRATPRAFLSQAGPRFDLELVQAEHHLGLDGLIAFGHKKGDPFWVALIWLAVRLGI
jgi:hypothetical protein